MTAEKITYDVVLDDLCKHIIANLDVVSVSIFDDYDKQDEPHGYNPNGGAAYHTFTKVLIQADSTIGCRVQIPFLPKGYKLVQLSLNDFYGPGSPGCHLYTDLYLTGPDIDRDDHESLTAALDEVGDELVKKLAPAIENELDAEYHDDFAEVQKRMKANTGSFTVQFDYDGAWLIFDTWVQE